jgi:ABC-type multidrug transport system fused ATPase/permease subunit
MVDQRKVVTFATLITLVSFIDLLGVLSLGLLGGYLSGLVDSGDFPIVGELSQNKSKPFNVMMLLSISISFFVLKNLSVLYVSRKFLFFLLKEQLRITERVNKMIFSSSYSTIRKAHPQKLSYSLNDGISIITTGVVGNIVQIVVDAVLLAVFLVILFFSDWKLAIVCTVYFGIAFYLLNTFILRRVSRFASDSIESTIQARTSLLHNLLLFRIIRTTGKHEYFQDVYLKNKKVGLRAEANYAWIQQAPKALIEVIMLLGILLASLVTFLGDTNVQTFSKLSIYLAVGLRVVPLLLRIQSSLFAIRSSIPAGLKTLTAINELKESQDLDLSTKDTFDAASVQSHLKKFQNLRLQNLGYGFPDSPEIEILRGVSVEVVSGERVVITGPSGAGKSTLCDIMLGLLEPSRGNAEINGIPAARWMRFNPGSISYLPQDTYLFEGTLRSNICIGLMPEEIFNERLNEVVKIAQLEDLVRSLPLGLDTLINPMATNISGGEKQRIGIARALYPNPSVIIMDEATSQLDVNTEDLLLNAISLLDDSVAVIYIAHRLSALKFFPRVIFLEDGNITFDGLIQDQGDKPYKLEQILTRSRTNDFLPISNGKNSTK